MDSIDAQCLVVDLLDPEGASPPQWRHPRDGSLHYRFAGSPRSFSWPADVVADMAADWRARPDAASVPAAVARHVDVHQRVLSLLAGEQRGLPDAVVHDLDAEEVQLIWEDEKLIVIIELDDERPLGEQLRGAGERGLAEDDLEQHAAGPDRDAGDDDRDVVQEDPD